MNCQAHYKISNTSTERLVLKELETADHLNLHKGLGQIKHSADLLVELHRHHITTAQMVLLLLVPFECQKRLDLMHQQYFD